MREPKTKDIEELRGLLADYYNACDTNQGYYKHKGETHLGCVPLPYTLEGAAQAMGCDRQYLNAHRRDEGELGEFIRELHAIVMKSLIDSALMKGGSQPFIELMLRSMDPEVYGKNDAVPVDNSTKVLNISGLSTEELKLLQKAAKLIGGGNGDKRVIDVSAK